MPIPLAVPLIAQGLSSLFGIFKGHHQNKLANKVVIPDATYSVSPYAQSVLGEAQRLKNSQMPGSADAGKNIMGNEANTVGAIDRNATSGAQALALISGAQGNTNNAFGQLRQQQGQYSMNMLNNYNNANQGMTDEMDKVFQDKLMKRQEAIAEKNALRGAANQNIGNGVNGITNGLWTAYVATHGGGSSGTKP